MLRDGRAIPEHELIETDVCIIGAGPAGISIAREFIRSRLRVCLVESGDARLIRAAQRLNDGRSVGYWYYQLASARARAFGGSSAHWWHQTDEDGRPYLWRSGPLDSVDFDSRPGIAHTGWPFSREVLIPFYQRAQKICQLGPFAYGVEDWEDPEARPRFPLPRDEFVTKILQYGNRTFVDYLGELARAQNVTTILNATVSELVTAEYSRTINEVTVKAEAGKAFKVKARAYVLAAGGIENARLLLLSNKTRTAGLGNTNDLVGRFFMERLSIRSGVIVPTDSGLLQRSHLYKIQFARGVQFQGVLRLNEKLMRSEGLLNAAMFVLPAHKAFTSEGVRSLVALYRAVRRRRVPGDLLGHAKNVAGDLDDVALTLYRQIIARGSAKEVFILRVQAEQSPNPFSRVTLDDARDAFGLRKARLDWRVTEFDRWSIRRTQEILDRELRRAKLGRLERKLGEEDPPALFQGAFHHMGTTRMHREASLGVVDANCRVHGVANLFVAGSSVFPTAGCANPTLTLVALAVRLADHLRDELAAG